MLPPMLPLKGSEALAGDPEHAAGGPLLAAVTVLDALVSVPPGSGANRSGHPVTLTFAAKRGAGTASGRDCFRDRIDW